MPRAEGNLIGGETELAKEHPSVPRHGIHSDEYLPPTEIGKARDDLIKAGMDRSAAYQELLLLWVAWRVDLLLM